MKLNIPERLTLVNSLPEKGNFATMKIIETLKDSLYPSEEESTKFEIKQVGKNISWNKQGGESIEIKITAAQKELLVKTLDALDAKEELTFQHYEVYKKFKK